MSDSKGGGNHSQLSDRDEGFFDEMINFADELNAQAKRFYSAQLSLNNQFQNEGADQNQQNKDGGAVQLDLNKDLMCEFLNESSLAAHMVTQFILKNTEQAIWEKQIEQKKFTHASIKTIQMAEKLMIPIINLQDGKYDPSDTLVYRNDEEPKSTMQENWIRGMIELEEKLFQIEEKDEDKKSVASKMSVPVVHRYHHVQKVNTSSSQRKIEEEEEKKQIPIALPEQLQEDEISQYIDILRSHKLIEIKRKEDQELKERNQVVEQQKINKELTREMKNAKYTFDFDGKRINMKGVNTEKLPPAHFPVNFQFKDIQQEQEKAQQKQKGKNDKQNPSQQSLNKQQQQQQGEQNVQQRNSQSGLTPVLEQNRPLPRQYFNYQEFTPNNGVTLYYQTSIKEGPRHQLENISNVEDLQNRLKLLNPNEPMRITKSEYMRITEKGNLNLFAKQTPQDKFSQSLGGSKMVNSVVKNSSQETFQKQKLSQDLGVSFFKEEKVFNKKRGAANNSILQDNAKVEIKNTRLKGELFIPEQDIQDELVNLEEKFKINQQTQQVQQQHTNEEKMKSANDEFNQKILRSIEWGKQKAGGNSFLPTLNQPKVKHDAKILRQTLSTLYIIPRERDQGQSIKVAKSTTQSKKKNLKINPKSETDTEFMRGTFYTTTHKFEENLRIRDSVK